MISAALEWNATARVRVLPPHGTGLAEHWRRRRAAGRYSGSGAIAQRPAGRLSASRASGRGGAGRGRQTAAPANLASITLPDLFLQGAGGAQPGQESQGTDGLSGSASSEGAAAVVPSGWKAAAAISLHAPQPLLRRWVSGKGTSASVATPAALEAAHLPAALRATLLKSRDAAGHPRVVALRERHRRIAPERPERHRDVGRAPQHLPL